VTVVELLEELPLAQRAALRARLLDERGYTGLERQLELAQAPPPAPVAQERPDSGFDGGGHGPTLRPPAGRRSYLGGNRQRDAPIPSLPAQGPVWDPRTGRLPAVGAV
jgi:hypothetical protein